MNNCSSVVLSKLLSPAVINLDLKSKDRDSVLARLTRLLRDPKLRQSLLTADEPAKVIALIREAETKL